MARKKATVEASVDSAPIVKRAGAFLGAEITGVDLTQPLDAAAVDAIRQAHAEHGVLVFPGQGISSQDLMRFGRYFGELSVHPFSTSTAETTRKVIRRCRQTSGTRMRRFANARQWARFSVRK
jgi:alpha-ketoglutarate-dependent taurine dioxygenase